MPSIGHVEDSGTEGAKAVMFALPVLNPAVKKPDENRVAFASITNSAVSESLGTPSKKLKPTVPVDDARIGVRLPRPRDPTDPSEDVAPLQRLSAPVIDEQSQPAASAIRS